jgi:hypothetical protein
MPATNDDVTHRIMAFCFLTAFMGVLIYLSPPDSPNSARNKKIITHRLEDLEARVALLEENLLRRLEDLEARVALLEESHLRMVGSSVMSPSSLSKPASCD